MKFLLRAMVALVLAACVCLPALARDRGQDQGQGQGARAPRNVLQTERDQVSYMIGMDVGKSLLQVGPDLDLDAFKHAVANAFAGGKPLIAEDRVQPVAQALMQRAAARAGNPAAAGKPPAVSRQDVGYLVGADVGRSLEPVHEDLELDVFVRAIGDRLAGRKLLLSDAEAAALRSAFSQRLQARLKAEHDEQAAKNQSQGAAFLSTNKAVKGVFVTGSGLQYMVLRQGNGPRPGPADKVQVNYEGRLLDGSVFDSSYERGQPAEFRLDQVIPGWTEGVGMMPVGSKYRFWIPGELAYGEKGTPGGPIGPNATLVFDVELMGIVH